MALDETRDVSFTYTATDQHGAISSEATATVTVTGVNDGPTAGDITTGATEDGASVTASFAGDDIDSDDDQSTLTYTLTSGVAEGSVVNNNDGTFSFDPGTAFQDLALDETRDVSFNYTATDQHGAVSSEATATVTVTGTNDAPVITLAPGNDAGTVTEDDAVNTVSGQLTSADVDNNATATWSVVGGGVGAFGTLAVDQTGQWTYTLDNSTPALDGLDTGSAANEVFTVIVTDDQGAVDSQQVAITIDGNTDNEAPIAVDDGGVPTGSVPLSSIDGINGFRLDGAAQFDQSGRSVSAAGDVNGDGIADIIIGAQYADSNGSNSGSSYIVFGSSTGGFSAIDDLGSLDGAHGFRLDGAMADDSAGFSVSEAGDVNGDGIDDVVVGARYADPNGLSSGSSYVVFGSDQGFAANIDLSSLSGIDGFRLDGAAADDRSGHSVSAAGDVNGDGIGDVIIGAYRADPSGSDSGSSYVVFGSDQGFAATLELSSLDGTDGFRLDGVAAGDRSGRSVSAAGDVNGDGVADVIVSAHTADPNGFYSGSSYVVFGQDTSSAGDFAASINLSSLNGTDGFRLDGAAVFDLAGTSVSTAGDVNGDGIDDIIVGAYGADINGDNSGSSYVVFGSDQGFSASIELGSLDGTDGFRIDGAGTSELSGRSVAAAGDVNGDGVGDLIIGASNASLSSGVSYLLFGRNTSESGNFASAIDLGSLDGTNGFRLDGTTSNDFAGFSVSGAGDFNDDGFDDVIVGAFGADNNGATSGSSYVVFGSNFQAGEDDGARLIGNVLANDTDVDGDSLTVSAFDGTSALGATITAGAVDGTFIFDATSITAIQTLAEGENLADTFSYTVSDGRGGTDTASVNITINGVNDAPVADAGGPYPVGPGEQLILDGSGSFDPDEAGGDSIVAYRWDLDSDGTADFFGETVTLSAPDVANFFAPGIQQTISLVVEDSLGLVDQDQTTVRLNTPPLAVDDSGVPVATVALSSLDGTDGFRLDGAATGDSSGRWVSSAGDVNDDGIDDFIVGAVGADPNGLSSGSSYVVFGRDTATAGDFAATIALSSLDGINGFRLDGAAAGDNSGVSVSSAGDVNGDGIDDLLVGALRADPNGAANAGTGYVVFGRDTAAGDFAATIDLSSLDGTDGFRLDGLAAGDYTGNSVSSAGDVNGDGIGDLIIGAPGTDPNGSSSGSSYVVFGRDTAVAGDFGANVNLSSLDGTNGFRLDGSAASNQTGLSVSGAGDVNGDGIDDVIVSAHEADLGVGGTNSGSNYVVFGRDTAAAGDFAASIALSSLDGTDGFRLDGAATFTFAGYALSGAGDVNGDGVDDVIIGAKNAGPNGGFSGSSYVVFGRDTAATGDFAAALNLGSLDGSNGFRLDGAQGGDNSGRSVSAAGDLNGDGIDDLIVGAFGASPNGLNSGSSYVVFGRATAAVGDFAATIDLSSLDGTTGFRLAGVSAGDNSGLSVSAAGDVNGDGLSDLIVGAFGADPNGSSSGSSYVVFGSNFQAGEDDGSRLIGNVLANDTDFEGDLLTVSAFDIASALGATISAGAADGTFIFDATTSAAAQALAAGETTTDTFSYAVSDNEGGTSNTATVSVIINGITDGDQTITGTAGDDTLFGGDGNDALIGDTGDDLFVFANGSGDDTVNDFTAGAGTDDVLDVSAFGFASKADAIAAATQAGADTVIQLDGDDSVTLLGVNAGLLHDDDFFI